MAGSRELPERPVACRSDSFTKLKNLVVDLVIHGMLPCWFADTATWLLEDQLIDQGGHYEMAGDKSYTAQSPASSSHLAEDDEIEEHFSALCYSPPRTRTLSSLSKILSPWLNISNLRMAGTTGVAA